MIAGLELATREDIQKSREENGQETGFTRVMAARLFKVRYEDVTDNQFKAYLHNAQFAHGGFTRSTQAPFRDYEDMVRDHIKAKWKAQNQAYSDDKIWGRNPSQAFVDDPMYPFGQAYDSWVKPDNKTTHSRKNPSGRKRR